MDKVTKTQARAAIREAREYLRDLERCLASADYAHAYFDACGTEPLAGLSAAYYDTVDALGRDHDGNPL